MRHSWIGKTLRRRRSRRIHNRVSHHFEEFPLILKIDGLARMREEHTVEVLRLRLQNFDGVVALRDTVRTVGLLGAVKSVNFLAQNRSTQCAAGLSQFLRRKRVWEADPTGEQDACWQYAVIQKHCFGLSAGEPRNSLRHIAFCVIFLLHLRGDAGFSKVSAGMKPGFRANGWNIRSLVDIRGGRQIDGTAKRGKLFRIPLVNATEAAEFALYAIVVTVMIGVARDK